MKSLIILFFTAGLFITLNAQSVNGKLTLNGKSETNLELKTNSAVQLFKEFKTGKYKLKFSFKPNKIPENVYGETIVFFDFITTIKKDGKLVKNLQRKQPIPYFPGEMFVPVEAFDFVGLLASDPEEEEIQMIGTMSEGKYSVQLFIKPVGFEGKIAPLEFSFVLRKRPGRTKS